MRGFVGLNIKGLPIDDCFVGRLQYVESVWVYLIKSYGTSLYRWVGRQGKGKSREQGDPHRENTDDMFKPVISRINTMQF